VELLRSAKRPAIIAGGGVHYSRAEAELAMFSDKHGIPVVETVAGKSSLVASHPRYAGPVGVTGAEAANAVVRDADVVLAVGTRLEDFTTGSWTLFSSETQFVGLNAARFDAIKHRSTPLVADAREGLTELSEALGDWSTDASWTENATRLRGELEVFVNGRTADDGAWPPSYAQLIGLVHSAATEEDYVLTAAGGLPGDLNVNWMSKAVASFDCEYGYSCMGYEISGAWGAAMARPRGEVFAMVGDGSYLMMNSDIYASVLSGHKMILVVCDNEGYAVIERLQTSQGGASYNNMLADSVGTGSDARVDFAAHAASMGAVTFEVHSLGEFADALDKDFTEGGAFWQVGVPEVSDRPTVTAARASMDKGLKNQRPGI
jgi:3D-(3,5/4)-trihydroxycyclohexane-1,2-dione acylhydrolase (decyclizing)